MLIDTLYALINDRAFLSGKPVSAADNDLAQADKKITLVCNHFHRIGEHIVINGYVHRIDMLFGIAGDADKLTVKRRYKRKILAFGIADDNIIERSEKAVEDFTLDAETLAGTRRTEDKTVRVL